MKYTGCFEELREGMKAYATVVMWFQTKGQLKYINEI